MILREQISPQLYTANSSHLYVDGDSVDVSPHMKNNSN
jgi:hypothetical protein